ncbi:MAG: tetratricopeptide repeat protein [Myxococcota bacterium]
MRWLIPLTGLLLAATACGSHRKEAVDPAPWQSEEGKQETRMGIAARMLELGYPEDAMTLLKLARQDGETGAEVDYLSGQALHQMGLHSEAEAPLRRSVEVNSKDARPWRTLGLVYSETKRPDEAIDAFRRACELDKNDAATWNNLGFLLYSVQRSPDAVPALRKAIMIDGSVAKFRRNLGFALFNDGDVEGAVEAFRAAGPLDDAWYNLGVAHEIAGDTIQAKSRYTRALEINPDHNKAKEALSRFDASASPEITP